MYFLSSARGNMLLESHTNDFFSSLFFFFSLFFPDVLFCWSLTESCLRCRCSVCLYIWSRRIITLSPGIEQNTVHPSLTFIRELSAYTHISWEQRTKILVVSSCYCYLSKKSNRKKYDNDIICNNLMSNSKNLENEVQALILLYLGILSDMLLYNVVIF